VHKAVKGQLIEALGREFRSLLGQNPKQCNHFVRIVNDKAFDRLVSYIDGADVVFGGEYDKSERFIAPTIIDNVALDSPIMQEEIFGPIFPVVTFETTEEAVRFVTEREKPLALYYFGDDKSAKYVLKHTSSGGACVNDTIMHIANEKLPFGGVGNSGMSSYHGRESFEVFSHRRAVVTTPTWIDVPFRYMPYKMFSLVKKLL
jgi:aldehyde dehydrogenase (NAD+)